MAGQVVALGQLQNLGYQLFYDQINPSEFYYLGATDGVNAPGVPQRYADVIIGVRNYLEFGEVVELRYLKMRSPLIQTPNVPEWVGTGYELELWVQPFFKDLVFALWRGL